MGLYMDFTDDIQQLDGAVEALSENWSKQNNESDNVTRFIYRVNTYYELLQCPEMIALSDEEQQYALHRWYNNKVSKVCERIFVEYGAVPATRDEDLHHTDIYINDMPFDVKVSVFPKNRYVQDMNLDLKRRRAKDRLIQWFYRNQSSEQRNCFNNRIFVVCEGQDFYQNCRLKQNYDQMEVKIKAYMQYLQQTNYTFNEVVVQSKDGIKKTVNSDIIAISQDGHNLKERLAIERCPQCSGHYELMVARLAAYSGNIIMKCPKCNNYINV